MNHLSKGLLDETEVVVNYLLARHVTVLVGIALLLHPVQQQVAQQQVLQFTMVLTQLRILHLPVYRFQSLCAPRAHQYVSD